MKPSLATLDGKSAVALLTSSADITLLVDNSGRILDAASGKEFSAALDVRAWVGKSWQDTVTSESQDKIAGLLKSPGGKGSRPRQVNHPVRGGTDVPIVYRTERAAASPSAPIIAIGKDLGPVSLLHQRLADAQQALEVEYARLRQADTRYRLLFQAISEAVVVVDADDSSILDINPAAVRLLGIQGRRLAGQPLAEAFSPFVARGVRQMLDTVRATGKAEILELASRSGSRSKRLTVSATLFRQESASHILLRLGAAGGESSDTDARAQQAGLQNLLERFPEAFVVTDPEGRVLAANDRFIDAAQLGTPEQARGQMLSRWLGRSAVDLRVILSNLQQHGSVRGFQTTLNGQLENELEVEVSAVAAFDRTPPSAGFVIRELRPRSVARRNEQPVPVSPSVERLTALIGRVPLKELVRESTDMIERLCIEAALELTGDNRASAAEMLGLSRQSLYLKLHRHGLGDLGSEA